MQTFQATLYGTDLPLAGIDMDASFTGDCLYLKAKAMTINCNDITISVGGFEHNAFFLNWHDTLGHAYTLKPITKNDIAWVMATAPPALHCQFKTWHQRRRSIQLVWTSIATITAVCSLSALLLWWRYDDALSWVSNHVSVAQEEQLGQSALSQIEVSGELIKKGVAFEALQNIGKRLTKNSAYHYQWLIKKDKTVNAFALPGGIIVVNSALIAKIDRPDELAAVLAHEVQHVEQRHALKSMINSLGWASALMLVLGDVNVATAIIAHQLGNMYFSRDREDEADRLGFQALTRAKIAPNGMVTLLEKLAKEPNATAPKWLSSHPDITQRIQTIQRLIKEQPCADCTSLVFDWQKIQRDKALRIS